MARQKQARVWLLVAGGFLSLAGCEAKTSAAISQRDDKAASTSDLGYNTAFEGELKDLGEISVEDFARRFPRPQYLAQLSWDPTTARFWDRVMLDPKATALNDEQSALQSHEPKAISALKTLGERSGEYDFRLNEEELAIYRRNGFVVSQRMGSHSFADLYHRIYVRDLPVIVTADSMLHAWHCVYDRLLEDLEGEEIRPGLERLLGAMTARLPDAQAAYRADALANSLKDADFFLCVARRLLSPGGGAMTAFDQEARVQAAVSACERQETFAFELFGQKRVMDFSQFKPRGRYDLTDESRQYFRGVMWLGRVDFRLGGTKDAEQERRELGAAIVLHDLLVRSAAVDDWRELDRLLVRFVGQSDCLNFSQLDGVLQAYGGTPASEMTDTDLMAIHRRLGTERIARQQIRGEYFCVDPGDPEKFVLPRSFAFLGQRFVLDSWALSKVVFDDIVRQGEKIPRRVPSGLDVCFAVLGNDSVTERLLDRMAANDGQKFRDGLPYQHNLAAVRNVVDRLPAETWEASIYSQWLRSLRALSASADERSPEAMRTEAWAAKATTTQLASWTQLRHDTVLYAKPSFTLGQSCYYPAGYVEPAPEFWRSLDEMVKNTAGFLEHLKARAPWPQDGGMQTIWRRERVESFKRFAAATGMLRAIVDKELVQAELSAEETKFLQEIVVKDGICGMPPLGGWYPRLFSSRAAIGSPVDAQKWTAIVTDVHTDPPDQIVGDPGCVIHEGVGNVDLLIVAVDNGADRVVYMGPAFSHFEFTTPPDERMTNGEWQEQLRAGKAPPRDDGTELYLPEGVNPDASKYGLEPPVR